MASITAKGINWKLIPLNGFLYLIEIIENGFSLQNKGSQTLLKLLFFLWDNFNIDERGLDEWVNQKTLLEKNVKHC